jgi:tetratricopeptide (TPR) repeat protein
VHWTRSAGTPLASFPAALEVVAPGPGPRVVAPIRPALAEQAEPAGYGDDRPAAPLDAPTAAQRYRSALDRIGRREYARAIEELDDAIASDPRLAVAYAARASAQFGLGRWREAADDYRAALGLDPELATPVYGLAECYRLLGDSRAAPLYQRYAESRSRDVREELRVVAARRAAELATR